MNFEFFQFNNDKDYEQYISLLKSFSKVESIEDKARHKNIVCTNYEIYSLPMSKIRDIAKSIYKYGNYVNFLSLCRRNSYEEVMIEGLVISHIKDENEAFKYFDQWLKYADCWAHVDSVTSSLTFIEKSINKDEIFNRLYKMSLSSKVFVARFGITAIMDYYLIDEYFEKVATLCKEVKNDDYYVKMAVAWLISFLYMKDSSTALKLLKSGELDKFTQNKAISKCRDSLQISDYEKEQLKLLRK